MNPNLRRVLYPTEEKAGGEKREFWRTRPFEDGCDARTAALMASHNALDRTLRYLAVLHRTKLAARIEDISC